MVLLNEKELETAKVLARNHLRAILSDTRLLLKYMEVIKTTDIYMTICLVLYSLKNLKDNEKESEE